MVKTFMQRHLFHSFACKIYEVLLLIDPSVCEILKNFNEKEFINIRQKKRSQTVIKIKFVFINSSLKTTHSFALSLTIVSKKIRESITFEIFLFNLSMKYEVSITHK